MKKDINIKGKSYRGISANLFAFPIIVFVTVMHILIVALIINVNHSSDRLSTLMKQSGVYQQDATSLQANNTILSETSNSYILKPINSDSSMNLGPLFAYAGAIDAEGKGTYVVERFQNYRVSDEARGYVANAADYQEQMKSVQIHAISLVDSVYPLPDNPTLAAINKVSLTTEELAMSNEARLALARDLIQSDAYVQLRRDILSNISACNNTIQSDFNKSAASTKRHINGVRNSLWVAVALVVGFLVATFVFFFRLIVKPLRKYSEDIAANRCINQLSSLIEMQGLVNAFNGLWSSRNRLESVLRAAAENDSLTGLPNRYCMEKDLLTNDHTDSSMAVLVFDVNFLKQTNDEKGHLAGDELLRKSASCICECFAIGTTHNCYRLGGDEFVAVLYGCDKSDIEKRIELFNRALVRENISVSVGYAYSPKASQASMKELMAKADENMYENKRQFHESFHSSEAADVAAETK